MPKYSNLQQNFFDPIENISRFNFFFKSPLKGTLWCKTDLFFSKGFAKFSKWLTEYFRHAFFLSFGKSQRFS